MFIHNAILKAVLPLLEKYDPPLTVAEIIGEMNHAAWELSVLSDAGVQKLMVELNEGPNAAYPPSDA